jgi:hypothetical protein
VAPPKITDYVVLQKKLKHDLVNSTPSLLDQKTKKDEQTYFIIEKQLCFLNVCDYKEYNKPSSFN